MTTITTEHVSKLAAILVSRAAERKTGWRMELPTDALKVSAYRSKVGSKYCHLVIEVGVPTGHSHTGQWVGLPADCNERWTMTRDADTLEGWATKLGSKQAWRLGNELYSDFQLYDTGKGGGKMDTPELHWEHGVMLTTPVVETGWVGSSYTGR